MPWDVPAKRPTSPYHPVRQPGLERLPSYPKTCVCLDWEVKQGPDTLPGFIAGLKRHALPTADPDEGSEEEAKSAEQQRFAPLLW